MPVKLANNATSRLAANISPTDTTITIAGNGSDFPVLGEGDWFPITVVNSIGALEIMRVTERSGDLFTVVRGQEGTAPKSFQFGDRVELRLTAGTFIQLLAEVPASGVYFTPSGGLVATDVQAAIQEVNARIPTEGSFAAVNHTHKWGQITEKPTVFPPEIGNSASTAKAGDYTPSWEEVTGKPETFPPIIGTTSTTAKAGNYAPSWGEVTGKPSTYAPSSHTHPWSQITGAPAQATRWPSWSEVTGKPTTFPSTVSTSQVGTANAGLSVGAVGAYRILTTNRTRSGDVAGSNFTGSPAGTYRIMGLCNSTTSHGENTSTTTYYYLCLRVA